MGDFQIVDYQVNQVHDGLAELNRLFRMRWKHEIFSKPQLHFQTMLVNQLPDSAKLKLTALQLNGECVSVLYDIRYGDTEFNFLSGYAESLHPRLSLGMLHIGYAIEQAYADGIKHFDLLLGKGRQSRYKGYFRGVDVSAETLQLIRNPLLGATYRGYDTIMNMVRKEANK
jgi:CelD/BcsL family acetyltransferase involved in cellulose biosynthesis